MDVSDSMHLGTIIGIFGLAVSALGAWWYWRLRQILAGQSVGRVVSTTMTGNPHQTVRYAIGLVCIGLVVFLIGMTVSFLARDEAP